MNLLNCTFGFLFLRRLKVVCLTNCLKNIESRVSVLTGGIEMVS